MVVADGYQYLRDTARTWAHTDIPSRDVALVAGRWLKTSNTRGGYGGADSLCHGPGAFAGMSPGTGLTKGTETSLDGTPALELKDDSGTAYVTISAQPEFLELDSPGTRVLAFSRYDAPAVITTPAASQMITLPGI
jgi:hypothetical protein